MRDNAASVRVDDANYDPNPLLLDIDAVDRIRRISASVDGATSPHGTTPLPRRAALRTSPVYTDRPHPLRLSEPRFAGHWQRYQP